MKKIISLLLSFILVFSTMQVVFADTNGSMSNFKEIKTYTDGQFTDVSSEDWFAENVKKAYELGLISGTSETTFTPDSNLNVAEVITLTSRIHDIYYGNNHNFESTTPWYQSYLNYAYKNFLTIESVNNSNEDPFVPFYGKNFTQDVTRGHFAMFLAWALPEKEFEAINNIPYGSIPDVEEDECYDEIYLLYNAGILAGSDEYGTFNQYSPIKRSEVAAIITRVVDKSLRKKFKLSPVPVKATSVELDVNGQVIKPDGLVELVLGKSTKLKPVFYPENATANTDVTWKFSGSAELLELSKDGVATAKKLTDTPGRFTVVLPDGKECKFYFRTMKNKVEGKGPVEYYVDKYGTPLFRTVTSVTGVPCTTSTRKKDFLTTNSDEGYIPGCLVYTYDFDAELPLTKEFMPRIDAFKDNFLTYIDYLENDLGLTRTKTVGTGELTIGATEVSCYYDLGIYGLAVSWNELEYSKKNSIMIMLTSMNNNSFFE